MNKFEESNFYKALQDFFINADKKTFLQFLAEFYNRTEGIIDKNNIQDDLIKELRELYLEFNEKGIDENIVREKVDHFLGNSVKIKDIITKLNTNTNNIENINLQLDTKTNKNEFVNRNELKPYKLFDFFHTEDFINVDDDYSAQGMCITDNTINICILKSDETKQIIYRFNKTNYRFLDKTTFTILGHCNDMTFIPETKEIYVTNGSKITVLDSVTLNYKKEISNNSLTNIHQVGYDKINKKLAIGSDSSIYKCDLELNILISFP